VKAKEYAEEFKKRVDIDNPNEEDLAKAMYWIMLEMSAEGQAIVESRKCYENSAVIAVLQEQDQKWKAVCRRMPGILSPDGFHKYFSDKIGVDIRQPYNKNHRRTR
jgi:hypothetical protein